MKKVRMFECITPVKVNTLLDITEHIVEMG